MIPSINEIFFQNITPDLDKGRFAIKRGEGDLVKVNADIFRHGHDTIRAFVLYRIKGDSNWIRQEMDNINPGLDLWQAEFKVEKFGFYEYTIEAWSDPFYSWLHDTRKKFDSNLDLSSEFLEGIALLKNLISIASKPSSSAVESHLKRIEKSKDRNATMALFEDENLIEIAKLNPEPSTIHNIGYSITIRVDKKEFRFSAWYEFFPRSQGKIKNKSATFKDCIKRIPEIKAMGFNVIYMPPIHPIGLTHRKGPNNSLVASKKDPGCPYSMGSKDGGHMAIEPGLGTIQDFRKFADECSKNGIALALDFALNASPDHPYVKDHPEWFSKRPDGTIKYAENPPKKYEDIYPFNFNSTDKDGLWNELKEIILFWASNGVDIFRVDNPHTKPILFWEWLISETQKEHPQLLFLSEAFTKPRVMQALAMAGFTQSYTYFTWRTEKEDIIEYFTELTNTTVSEYMLGNLFTSTPDILPYHLQYGGRPAFKQRLALAATLSTVYGVYSGYELCENRAIPGKEEYLNSEKYEIKVWDWERPGNIKDYITIINKIRQENSALQEYQNLRFLKTDNDKVLAFYKKCTFNDNLIIVVINLDSFNTHSATINLPLSKLGIPENTPFTVNELISEYRYQWFGENNFVELDPFAEPAQIFRVELG